VKNIEGGISGIASAYIGVLRCVISVAADTRQAINRGALLIACRITPAARQSIAASGGGIIALQKSAAKRAWRISK